MRRAVVLGGGGITGIAWEIGLLAGLAREGVDLSAADLVVGTSAGSVAGAQLLSGTPLEELYERQLAPPNRELGASIGPRVVLGWAWAMARPGGERRGRARLGRAAIRRRTVPEDARREVIASRLPSHEWPRTQFKVTAAEAESGEFVAFDRDSGVPLVDAVAASCAVPLVWPPMTVSGRRYVDGGIRSPMNADLATGCDVVLAIGPQLRGFRKADHADAQISRLGTAVQSLVLTTDDAAKEAIGRNVLDPVARPGAARAGRTQAAAEAPRVAALWNG